MPRRAGRLPLTPDAILHAALRLVDEQGIDALSMRRLAAELGVDPMAIYHHVPGKQALTAGLVAMVFAELRLPWDATQPPSAWQHRVRAWAYAYHDLARAHPNLVLHLVTNPAASTVARLQAEEALYAALSDAGLAPAGIVAAAALLVDYLNGVALAESTGLTESAGAEQTFLARLHEQPPDALPTMRRVYQALAAPTSPLDAFGFALDILIAGIETLSAHTQPAPHPAASAPQP